MDDRGEEQKTYTRFSPLGDRNHAAAHMARMTKRPMKTEYLEGSSFSFGVWKWRCEPCKGAWYQWDLPLRHFDVSMKRASEKVWLCVVRRLHVWRFVDAACYLAGAT